MFLEDFGAPNQGNHPDPFSSESLHLQGWGGHRLLYGRWKINCYTGREASFRSWVATVVATYFPSTVPKLGCWEGQQTRSRQIWVLERLPSKHQTTPTCSGRKSNGATSALANLRVPLFVKAPPPFPLPSPPLWGERQGGGRGGRRTRTKWTRTKTVTGAARAGTANKLLAERGLLITFFWMLLAHFAFARKGVPLEEKEMF